MGKADSPKRNTRSQLTGNAFTGRLESCGIRISMDGQGQVLDNIFVERLWRTVIRSTMRLC